MRFGEFAFLFVRSLNPANYTMLVTRKKRDTTKYFIMLLFFSILLGFFFSIPKILDVPNKLNSTLLKFETFNITGLDIKTKEPIVLLKFPKTVLDLTDASKNISNEAVLITNSDIIWKKLEPNLFEFKLFTTEKKPIGEYSNLLSDVDRIKGGTFWLFFIFLLPSFFFVIYLFYLIKYVIIISIVTLVAFIIIKLKKKKVTPFRIWRTAVFSSGVMIVLELVLSPLFNYNIIFSIFPLLLYLVLFFLSMLVISEKEINIKKFDFNE